MALAQPLNTRSLRYVGLLGKGSAGAEDKVLGSAVPSQKSDIQHCMPDPRHLYGP